MAEERISRSFDALYPKAFEKLNDAVAVIDAGTRFTTANSASVGLFGVAVDELLGQRLLDFVPAGSHVDLAARLDRCREGEASVFEMEIVRGDGTSRVSSITLAPLMGGDGGFAGSLAILRDVTEQAHAVEELRKSEQSYRSLFDSMLTGLVVFDVVYDNDGRISDLCFVEANPAFEKLTGIPFERVVGKTIAQAFSKFDRSWFDDLTHVAESGESCHFERMSPNLDKHFEVIAYRPELGRVVAVFNDISERKLSEEEHVAAAERWKMLFEVAPDGCFITDMKGTFIHGNRAAEELVGYPADELIGKSFLELKLLSKRDLARAAAGLAKAALGRAIGPEEYTLRCKDGGHSIVEIQSYPIKLDGRRCVFGIARDISRRHQSDEEKTALEAQLAQAQKMEAIGRLAGGVAHDINNALGAIMGAASALSDEVESDDQKADVDTILAACRKGSRLTRDLLGFARKGKYTKEIISLEEAVQRVVDLLKRTISKKIAIYTRLDDSLAPVEGDASQLENALMNVCINAADAMGGDGQLVIESSNVEIGEPGTESFVELAPGRYVRLRVSDNGGGMDTETLERAFEPFYTTKPQGKGTGLGLSMVYGVVRNHGGSVLIDSAPDQGTTVTMLLPIATEERISSEAATPHGKLSEIPGTVGVLLVDDEPLVIRSTKRLLERLGYTVYTAVNGRDGLEVYQSCQELIDVVVLDLLMPEMDGDETLRALLELNPGIKVVMATGFTEDSKIEELLDAGALGFVEKPFDIEDLADEMKLVIRGEKHSRSGKSSSPPG